MGDLVGSGKSAVDEFLAEMKAQTSLSGGSRQGG